MPTYRTTKLPRSATILATSLSVLLIILTATAWRPAIVNQLNRWKLLPESEKLTELYFTQPNSLPSTYVPGQAQKINFTVHNVEYQTMAYQYRIVEESQDGSQQQTLASNTFKLGQDQYQSVSFTGPLADMGPRAKLVVEVPTVNESVDYLLTRSAQ